MRDKSWSEIDERHTGASVPSVSVLITADKSTQLGWIIHIERPGKKLDIRCTMKDNREKEHTETPDNTNTQSCISLIWGLTRSQRWL